MAKERSAESVALTILTIAEIPNFWSGFLPSLFTIGHFSSTESSDSLYWIRYGEANAIGLSLTLGIGASIVSKSWLPFVGTVAMCAFLLMQYEKALAAGKGNDITDQGGRDDA